MRGGPGPWLLWEALIHKRLECGKESKLISWVWREELAARPEFKGGQIQVFSMGKGKKDEECMGVWKSVRGRKKLGAEEVGCSDK